MTLFSKNWMLASFSLTVLSSPYWPWMPPLGFALLCPLVLLVCIKFAHLRIGGGIVLATLLIIAQSNAVKTQSRSIFKAGQDITIKGKVDSFFTQISYSAEGTVTVNSINGETTSAISSPRIRLFSPVAMQIGDEFEFNVIVKPVIGRLNEAGFDMESFFMSQGWVARASVKQNSRFKVISKPTLRASLYHAVKRYTQDSSFQGMILALVFGDRSGVSSELWEQLRNSGLIHLVAISGLHIGIAFGLGYLLGSLVSRISSKFLWSPFIFGAGCAFGYAWLAGFSLPTQRALTMCLINVLMVMAGIRLSVVQRILLTLAAVLAIDPFASLANSFWLSFIAVCLVLYLLETTKTMNKWQKALISQLLLVLLMAPVSAYFFGGISWAAVVYNLVFIPWFSVVIVPLLFFTISVSYIPIIDMSYLWTLVDWAFKPLAWALPHSSPGWIAVSDTTQILMLLAVVGWFLRTMLRLRTFLISGAVIIGHLWFRTPNGAWRIDILDVGHGLSVLFEKNGQFLLYDTGSSWSGGSYVQSVLMPLLIKRGASQLDTVIYSHLDDDHAGGRHDIERHFVPNHVYSSQPLSGSSACVRGKQWDWQGLSLTVLWPPKIVERAYNQHSCVIRVLDKTHAHSVLLSGDVTAVGEWLLARDSAVISSDVMLVPHHGSNTSSTSHFIQTVNPGIAIASLAKGNRWNLPHRDVVERYNNQGVKWLDTGESGQITLQYRAENRRLFSMRQDGVIPWYRQTLRKQVE